MVSQRSPKMRVDVDGLAALVQEERRHARAEETATAPPPAAEDLPDAIAIAVVDESDVCVPAQLPHFETLHAFSAGVSSPVEYCHNGGPPFASFSGSKKRTDG
jgi:hypothetical protein